jgi:hypothetical protein
MTGINTATSNFSAAETIDGSEIIGIVQGGSNVRTTTAAIKSYAIADIGYSTTTALAIGHGASSGPNGVSLGVEADVRNTKGIAIGYHSYASYDNTIAIGTTASTTGNYDVSIGFAASSSYAASIAIGSHSGAGGAHSLGLGYHAQAANTDAIAIGTSSGATANCAVAIGLHSGASGARSLGLGYHTQASSTDAIAIGSGSAVTANYAVAIGAYSAANGANSLSFGYHTRTANVYAIAIGDGAFVSGGGSLAIAMAGPAENYASSSILIGGWSGISVGGTDSVVIGNHSSAILKNSIAVGLYAATANYSAIAIGYKTNATGQYAISIGYNNNSSQQFTVSIGAHSQAPINSAIAIGHAAQANGIGCVSLGANSYSNSYYAIAVGPYTRAYRKGIAVGAYSHATQYAAALGFRAYATGNESVAVLGQALGNNAIALGRESVAHFDNSIVLGSDVADYCQASFVVRGGASESMSPTTHEQKFFGATTTAIAATITISDTSGNSVVVSFTPGAAGNSIRFGLLVSNAAGINVVPIFGDNDMVVVLGTDGSGNANTTWTEFMALFPTNGLSMSGFSGTESDIVSGFATTGSVSALSGGSDGVTSLVLTADGQAPGSDNLPAVGPASVSRVAGQVVGYFPGLVSGNAGDSAVFVLTPIMLISDGDGNYTFVGTPTFVLESSSDGASGWTVPILMINSSTQLYLTVIGEDVDLNWLGFLSIDSTQ